MYVYNMCMLIHILYMNISLNTRSRNLLEFLEIGGFVFMLFQLLTGGFESVFRNVSYYEALVETASRFVASLTAAGIHFPLAPLIAGWEKD